MNLVYPPVKFDNGEDLRNFKRDIGDYVKQAMHFIAKKYNIGMDVTNVYIPGENGVDYETPLRDADKKMIQLFMPMECKYVEDGVETDIYGSYSGEISGFSYSIGATGYYYSGQFDTEYEEINLGLSYGPVSLEHSIGTWDGDFDAVKAGKNDEYSFTAITGEYNGLYATFGAWGDDADGDYYEVGYNAEFSGFDVGAFYVSGDDDANALTTDTTSLIFTIGKSFDL